MNTTKTRIPAVDPIRPVPSSVRSRLARARAAALLATSPSSAADLVHLRVDGFGGAPQGGLERQPHAHPEEGHDQHGDGGGLLVIPTPPPGPGPPQRC